MKKLNAICAAFLLALPSTAFAQIVSVTGGQIRGAMLEQGGAVFKGIPYAAPPVGDLRWREPAPVQRWPGVRDTTSFSPACAQSPIFIPSTMPVSEDCLYLNIWTAQWPAISRKPVMVWFPGGGNFGGSAREPVYDSDTLARRGVVLVTLNFRLGPFGFFSHPALTRESAQHASGNQGVQDQIAALKWVRANIAKFGGDPDNVTIFGESAGAMDVNVLMTSPLSKGLFHRAIAESGPTALSETIFGKPDTLAQAEKRGQMSAARWKLPAGASAADLRRLSTDEILKMEPDYLKSSSSHKPTTIRESFPNGGVVIDGYVVPKNPNEVFAAGEEHRVALLIGSQFREWIPGTRPPADLGAALDDIFGPLSGRARMLYVGEPDPLYGTPASQLETDASFRCGSVAQLAWHASARNTAYQFEFAHPVTGRETVGNNHAAEVAFVFGTINQGIFAGPPNPPVKPNSVDAQVSDTMQRYWTNFAKTGDPNGPGLPVWPKFTPDARAYIQFTDAGPVAKEGLRRPYCDLFIENVSRQMLK
ncbi:MAG TPA: carboxylesterase family protein [Rhizomicrobium sp.]|nr:carboxylesterase family protein [Rhizomicrobium sp.]